MLLYYYLFITVYRNWCNTFMDVWNSRMNSFRVLIQFYGGCNKYFIYYIVKLLFAIVYCNRSLL